MSEIRSLRSYLNRRRLIRRLGLVRRADIEMLGNPYGGYRVPS